MFRIDPGRADLAAEFKAKPFGPHSGELQRVVNLMRATPLPGRYVLVTLAPHREWGLARLGPARSGRIEMVKGVRYHSPEEAEWDIFKRRWQELTGQTLDMT
jgi:hypothetical protein